MLRAEDVIALLDLRPLPREGGYYRETYRSAEYLPAGTLPRYARAKSASTAMYYLLTPDTFSALHRLPTDEVYHFYLGDPVELLQLLPGGAARLLTLGPDLRGGQELQVTVPSGVWQGSSLRTGGAFALLGTTVAPAFDFDDYEPGTAELLHRYPAFAERIRTLLGAG